MKKNLCVYQDFYGSIIFTVYLRLSFYMRRKCQLDYMQNYFQIAQTDWQEIVVTRASFERQKVEIHIFDRANIWCFPTWEFTTKEDLNLQKEVFLLNLRLTRPKSKDLVYFLWKIVSIRKICSVKAKAFPSLLVISVSQIMWHLLRPGDWHVISEA